MAATIIYFLLVIPPATAAPDFVAEIEALGTVDVAGAIELSTTSASRLNWIAPAAAKKTVGAFSIEATSSEWKMWHAYEVQNDKASSTRYNPTEPTRKDYEPIRETSYDASTATVTRFGPRFEIRVLADEPLNCRLILDGTLSVDPIKVASVPVGTDQDPRTPFDEQDVRTLRSELGKGTVRCEGSFRVLFKDADMSATSASGAESWSARRTAIVDGAYDSYYVIAQVTDGAVELALTAGSARLFSPLLDNHWIGEISSDLVDGTIQSDGALQQISRKSLSQEGAYAGVFRYKENADDDPVVAMRFIDAPDAQAQAAPAAPAGAQGHSWLPWLSWTVGLLVGVGGVGLAGHRWIPIVLHHRAAVANPPVAAAPLPPDIKPGSIEHFESIYKADPQNVGIALELALAYGRAGRDAEGLPLLLMAVQNFPKADMPRYAAALSLLRVGRVKDSAAHLDYAFRLNPMNVARFCKEAPGMPGAEKPEIQGVLRRWSRVFHETSHRGYA